MEDKIEVGEYVRTKNGIIFKVDKDKNNLAINEFMSVEGDRKIKKHSKNLKDLIEENDILEYQLFGKPKVDRVKKYKDGRTGEEMLLIEGFKLSNAKILSVTTHEQFEQMKYVIEE